MDIFDKFNLYLFHHPDMLTQLEFAFRIKYWCLLIIAIYFLVKVSLYTKQETKKPSVRNGQFLA